MAQIKVVQSAKPDPRTGAERRLSGVKFPYYDLDASVEVSRVIQKEAGGSCDRVHLAVYLGYKGIDNGSFMTRVTAAKMFGGIDQQGDQLRVTDRGRALVAPIYPGDTERAKVDAFLGVELFRKVYEAHVGKTLPPPIGLQRMLEGDPYFVMPKQAAATVKVMLASAEQAGFFKATGDRSQMVKPQLAPATLSPVTPSKMNSPELTKNGRNGGGGGDDGTIPPAIRALLTFLPAKGTALTEEDRRGLVALFDAAIQASYGG